MSIILRENIIILNSLPLLFCETLGLYAAFAKKYKTVNAPIVEKRLMNLGESRYSIKYWNYSQVFFTKLPLEKEFLQQPKFYSYATIFKKTARKLNAPFNQAKRRFLFFSIARVASRLDSRPIKLAMKSYFSIYSLFDAVSIDFKKIFICEEVANREIVPTFHELSQRDALVQLSDNLQFLIKKIINQKHFLLCLHLHNYCKSAPITTLLRVFAMLVIFAKYWRFAQSHIVFIKNKTEINHVSLVSNIRLLSFYNCFLFNALYV